MGKRAIARPLAVKRTSGSLPRFPMSITLLTDMAKSRFPARYWSNDISPGQFPSQQKNHCFIAFFSTMTYTNLFVLFEIYTKLITF